MFGSKSSFVGNPPRTSTVVNAGSCETRKIGFGTVKRPTTRKIH